MIYHIMSIFLYALLSMLVFRVVTLFFPTEDYSKWYLSIPFITALLFALHPIHTEAVANIKGRDEILAMMFALLSLYAVFRYVHHNSIPWLVASGLFMFTGVMAKENAITFLAVIPMSLYYFSHAKPKQWILAAIPGLIGAVAYILIRLNVIGYLFSEDTSQSIMNNPFLGMTSGEKSATVMYTLGKYLHLLVFPHPLTHDYYPYHIPIMQWSDPLVLLSLAGYIVLAVLAILGIRKKTVLSYSIIYYLATLSIVSNVVFPIGTFMNERFAFMPSLGWCLIVAYYALRYHRSGRPPKWLVPAILGLYIAGYAYKTITRIPAWESRLSLNQTAIKVSKNSARANCFMGTALFERAREINNRQERYDAVLEAEVYIDKAVAIIPDYLDANQMKSGCIAEHYRYDNDLDKLLLGFEQVLSRKANVQYIPKYCEYLNGRSPDAQKMRDFYYRVGYEILAFEKRQYNYALQYLGLGLQFDPNDARLNYATGKVYEASGNAERAQGFLNKAYALDPRYRQ